MGQTGHANCVMLCRICAEAAIAWCRKLVGPLPEELPGKVMVTSGCGRGDATVQLAHAIAAILQKRL